MSLFMLFAFLKSMFISQNETGPSLVIFLRGDSFYVLRFFFVGYSASALVSLSDFKFPWVINPVFQLNRLINHMYFNIFQPLLCKTLTRLHRATFWPVKLF